MPLRDDVRVLGEILGETIREQAGAPMLDLVERVRHAAIGRREGKSGAASSLVRILAGLSLEEKLLITRAVSHYFALTNLAERVHRLRRRREYGRAGSAPQPGSLGDVLSSPRWRRTAPATIRAAFERLRIEPVFTAHPTEAVRPDLLNKELAIAKVLVPAILNRDPTPGEAHDLRERIRAEVGASWQTEEHREERPRVADEREHILFYLGRIYQVLPRFLEELEQALGEPGDLELSGLFRFGSWVGGDMDGNPNVGGDTIRESLRRHRDFVLSLYQKDLGDLSERLTQSTTSAEFSSRVLSRWRGASSRHPEVLARLSPESRTMPYRVLAAAMQARVAATIAGGTDGYASADDLLADVRDFETSLREHRGRHAGLFQVRRLRQRMEVFGFHCASLDIRQDSVVHRRVLGHLLSRVSGHLSGHLPGEPDFAGLPSEARAALLRDALVGPAEALRASRDSVSDPETARSLDVVEAIREGLQRFGPEAIGPYIVSMARGVDDALAVLALARAGGLEDDAGAIPLDVAPLFETVADLEEAPHTMRELLADDLYRRHLARRGRQVVMLGYSDSCKDSGIAASRWALYRVQERLWAEADAAGIPLVLFHGRGGTISRGGTKPRAAILSQPPNTVRGHLRFTEQGEILHAKYGMRGIALRTFELVAGAVLESSAPGAEARPAEGEGQPREAAHHPIMALIAERSRTEYRRLVEDPDFFAYFRAATPIDVIERMQIGSRPASRRKQRGIEDLRAIPWVFAWTQSRHLLPGWYGVGSGLQAAATHFGARRTKEAVGSWLFLSTLLADVEMVLAKADLDIAARYAALAGPSGKRIFSEIVREFELTRDWVSRLQGVRELLAKEPALQRSIRLRNPYVDPMSLIQIDLLRRWREGGRRSGPIERALFSSVKGIARGLQNTG
ncbi:MAG: phosphoenolpyruvate carboxylase [Candidatus Eisenbacteria bacterium]